MSRLPAASVGPATGVLSCGLAAALVVSALSLSTGQARYFFLATVVLLALGACLALPVQTLPTVALVAIVFLPDRIADYSVSPVVIPATVVLSVWAVRRLLTRSSGAVDGADETGTPDRGHERRLRRWLSVATVLLSVVLVLLVVVSPSKRLSVAWTFTVVIAVTVPVLVGDVEREVKLLGRALPWLGAVTSAYAIAESLLQRNVVYDPIYDRLGLDELQHWAVYRSDSSLGHPLTAGLFFAVVLAFCIGRWLETGQHHLAVLALLNGVGIVTTVSRGSYLAGAVAVVAVLLTAMTFHRRHRLRYVVVLALFAPAALLAVNSNAFVERGLSAEGASSLNSRTALPAIAADTARAYHWLGGGPANSLTLAAPYNFQHLPIENSYLQLLIGIGAPGLALFVLIVVLATVIAVRRRNLAAVGALVAYATAISGYAALDSRRDLLVLLGVLVMLSLQRRGAETAGAPVLAADLVRPGRRAVPASTVPQPVPARTTFPRRRKDVSWACTPGLGASNEAAGPKRIPEVVDV